MTDCTAFLVCGKDLDYTWKEMGVHYELEQRLAEICLGA